MPQPLALGLVGVGRYASSADRALARVNVGVFAAAEGLALIEVFEVTGEVVRDESTLAGLANLARRAGATVLLIAGDVRSHRLVRALNLTDLTPHKIDGAGSPADEH